MKKLIVVLAIVALAITACSKVYGPFPPKPWEICVAVGLDPECEEWTDYCFEKYIYFDMEDKEWVKSLVSCD
jgi:hypothetical protein